MLRLDTTTRKLQAVLAGAVTTNQLPILVSWSDKTSTTYSGGSTPSNTNSTTAVDICAAPGASTIRDIDYISVRNADTAAATITIRYNDNATTYDVFKTALAVGDHLTYVHGSGWTVVDSSGNVKLKTALVTSGTSILKGDGSGGIANATANTDYVTPAYVQNATLITLSSVAGTDTITATAPSPFSALADGQEFSFFAAGANTGAVTLNLNSVGAKSVTKSGGTALAAGDIPAAGAVVKVKYDLANTRFEILGGAGGSGSTSFSDATFDIHDNTDATKILKFEVSGITTGATRTIAVPDASGMLALASGTGGANVVTETAGSTTPSVAALTPFPVGVLSLGNAGTYTITQFTGGVIGQILVVINNNTGTITVDRSNAYLDGGANQVLGLYDAIVLTQTSANIWKQIGKLCANV